MRIVKMNLARKFVRPGRGGFTLLEIIIVIGIIGIGMMIAMGNFSDTKRNNNYYVKINELESMFRRAKNSTHLLKEAAVSAEAEEEAVEEEGLPKGKFDTRTQTNVLGEEKAIVLSFSKSGDGEYIDEIQFYVGDYEADPSEESSDTVLRNMTLNPEQDGLVINTFKIKTSGEVRDLTLPKVVFEDGACFVVDSDQKHSNAVLQIPLDFYGNPVSSVEQDEEDAEEEVMAKAALRYLYFNTVTCVPEILLEDIFIVSNDD